MKSFFFDCGTRDATASLGILVLRVLTGMMMLAGHGVAKIENFGKLKSIFPVPDFFPLHYMNSQTSLIACIAAEVGAAALIVLGVATRPAAFMLGFTMVVAAFHTHHGAPWFMGPGVESSKEPALLYLVPMIAIILTGAGAYSIDAAIHKEGKRRRW